MSTFHRKDRINMPNFSGMMAPDEFPQDLGLSISMMAAIHPAEFNGEPNSSNTSGPPMWDPVLSMPHQTGSGSGSRGESRASEETVMAELYEQYQKLRSSGAAWKASSIQQARKSTNDALSTERFAELYPERLEMSRRYPSRRKGHTYRPFSSTGAVWAMDDEGNGASAALDALREYVRASWGAEAGLKLKSGTVGSVCASGSGVGYSGHYWRSLARESHGPRGIHLDDLHEEHDGNDTFDKFDKY